MEKILIVFLEAKITKVMGISMFSAVARCAFNKDSTKEDCIRFAVVALFIVTLVFYIAEWRKLPDDATMVLAFVMGIAAREVMEILLSAINKILPIVRDKVINKIK